MLLMEVIVVSIISIFVSGIIGKYERPRSLCELACDMVVGYVTYILFRNPGAPHIYFMLPFG